MFDFFRKKTVTSLIQATDMVDYSVDTSCKSILYSFIEKKTGIILDESKLIIEQKIISYAQKKKIPSFAILLENIQKNISCFEEFMTLITINETYFFREYKQIKEALEVYKECKSQKLRILSLPSSTGEEIYTIIIAALEMGFVNFEVFGVDIDKDVISQAQKGAYKERSVHRIKQNILKKYFRRKGDIFVVQEQVKQFAKFQVNNLFEENLNQLGKFDIIFSRNMFIYFNDEKKIQAYKQLQKLKKDNKTKIYLGHADVSSSLDYYIRNQE
ncbi:CheR family methyltransferase [Sulfurimonas sp.]